MSDLPICSRGKGASITAAPDLRLPPNWIKYLIEWAHFVAESYPLLSNAFSGVFPGNCYPCAVICHGEYLDKRHHGVQMPPEGPELAAMGSLHHGPRGVDPLS